MTEEEARTVYDADGYGEYIAGLSSGQRMACHAFLVRVGLGECA